MDELVKDIGVQFRFVDQLGVGFVLACVGSAFHVVLQALDVGFRNEFFALDLGTGLFGR